VPIPVPVPAVAVCAATDAPLAPGTTHVVWQLAAVELHCIMQVVTAEVTLLVSGVIGVGACAKAVPDRMTEDTAAETANTIVTRRMNVSSTGPSHCSGDGSHHTQQR
jgi:hypothetical protein